MNECVKKPTSSGRDAQPANDDQARDHAVAEHIGRRLAQRRGELHLTLHQVANSVGISLQQVHRYETGASAVSATRLWKLAAALRVAPAYFYEGIAFQGLDFNGDT